MKRRNRSSERALPKTIRLSSSGGLAALPVRMARSSMKLSFTGHSLSTPSCFSAASNVFVGEGRRFQHRKLLGRKRQRLFQRALLRDEDLRRGHHIVLEEEVGHVAELRQRFDARLHQRPNAA